MGELGHGCPLPEKISEKNSTTCQALSHNSSRKNPTTRTAERHTRVWDMDYFEASPWFCGAKDLQQGQTVAG